jgi:hypothetical protein
MDSFCCRAFKMTLDLDRCIDNTINVWGNAFSCYLQIVEVGDFPMSSFGVPNQCFFVSVEYDLMWLITD